MPPSKTATGEFDHDYLTVWEQGVAGGGVSDELDAFHVVRCQGFAYDTHALEGATYLDAEPDNFGRIMRYTNAPVWLTLGFAKSLLDRHSKSGYDRLVAGELVTTSANFYRVEEP